MHHFIQALRKYAQFSGRSSRAEFWWFFFLASLLGILLAVLDSFFGTYSESLEMGLLSTVFGLATLIPLFSVGARRLHDADSSGWWQLLLLVPFFGAMFLVYLMVCRGSPEVNRYGPPATA